MILAALAPFIPDLIASVGGLVVSPIFDFIKKKFIKGSDDTPDRTMGNLATTKPEVLPAYVEAMVKLKEMDIKWFNRDVVGTVSVYVANLRASIRPLTVLASLVCLFLDGFAVIDISTGARVTFELCVTSWMGDRFTMRDDT
jgi:hypothetical protein